jgi:hypothetical protein
MKKSWAHHFLTMLNWPCANGTVRRASSPPWIRRALGANQQILVDLAPPGDRAARSPRTAEPDPAAKSPRKPSSAISAGLAGR